MNTFHIFDYVSPYWGEIVSRSVKGALLIVLILVLRRLLKHRITPAWRHALWLLVPVVLFWPKFPASVCSLDNFVPVASDGGSLELGVRSVELSHSTFYASDSGLQTSGFGLQDDVSNANSISQSPNPAEASAFGLQTEVASPNPETRSLKPEASMLFVLWNFVLLLLLARIVWQTLMFRRVIAASQPITDAKTLDILTDIKTRLHIRRDIALCESPQIAGPTLYGLVRPRILFPAGFAETLDEMRLAHVLMHELAHWKRGDLWTGLIAALTVAVHWFNPFLWLASRKMNSDREEASDALVLATLGHAERADYGDTLLMLSEQLAHSRTIRLIPGAAGIMETRSMLTRRIEMITSQKRFSFWAKLFCLVFVLLIGAVLLTSAMKRDAGEKLFGLIPIQKKQTPNNATVSFETIPKRSQGMPQEMTVTVRGKFQTPNGEALGDNVRYTGMFSSETYSISLGNSVAEDGTFSVKVGRNANVTLFLEDKSEQWAAPVYSFDTYDLEGDEMDVTIPVDRPVLVIGHVRDKETGEPLSGVRVAYVPQYPAIQHSRFLWTVTTDSEGIFRKAVSTGEYMFIIDSADSMYLSGEWGTPEEKAIYGRTLVFEDLSEPTVELTYSLPKLFTGQLLNPDGTPAINQSVAFSDFHEMSSRMYTSTNDEGIFHLYQTPQNVVMTVNSPDPGDHLKKPRLHRWIENELVENPQDVTVFQLMEAATIRARFINAKTGEPFTDFSVGSLQWCKPGDECDISNPHRGFTPQTTDVPGEWLFTNATPGVEYHFNGSFLFPEGHRSNRFTATADESGQYLDLGDVQIDTVASSMFVDERYDPLQLRVFDLSGREVREYEYATTEFPLGSGIGRNITRSPEYSTLPYYPGVQKLRVTQLVGVRDPANRWAAEPILLTAPDDWKTLTELRVDAVKGEMIRGIVLDETTGKPISGMPLTLVRKFPPPQSGIVFAAQKWTLEWKLATDADGRFAVRMPPGEYGIGFNETYHKYGMAVPGNPKKELWTRSFRLEEGRPVSLDFRIPAPFVGRVFTAAGKPAVNAGVELRILSGSNALLKTDANGEFRLCEPPEPYSYFKLESDFEQTGEEKQRLIYWIEPGESLAGKTVDLRLSDIDAVGRQIDAKTGTPGRSGYVSVEANHPSGSGRYATATYYLTETPDRNDGKFRVRGLVPGVRYTFRFGGHDSDNGAIIIPGDKGNTIDLGDVAFGFR